MVAHMCGALPHAGESGCAQHHLLLTSDVATPDSALAAPAVNTSKPLSSHMERTLRPDAVPSAFC
jgi:hypothetical protein